MAVDNVSRTDVLRILSALKSATSYLPCNVQRGRAWMDAWDALDDDEKNDIIESASIATDIIESFEKKYFGGGANASKP